MYRVDRFSRLPADELDRAGLDVPLDAYERSDLFERAVAAAANESTRSAPKALLQALVHEIRVKSRQEIQLVFRVPRG